MFYLLAERHGHDWSVSIAKQPGAFGSDTSGNSPTRISPLFPLELGADVCPVSPRCIYFFFMGPRTSKVCAVLKSALSPEKLNNYCTSLGQASLVRIGEEPEKEEQKIIDILVRQSAVTERWDCVDGKWIVGRMINSMSMAPESSDVRKQIAALRSTNINGEVNWLACEIAQGLESAITHARRYSPWRLASYQAIIAAVNNDIGKLGEELAKREDLGLCNQIRADMAQLNASLAYANSQEYSGAHPILENPCPIHMHSLLGIGNACNGISAFTSSLESVFSKHQVDKALESPQFLSSFIATPKRYILQEDNAVSSAPPFDMENYILPQTDAVRPKLVHFSGRLGYRETEYSVTAALNALQGASMAEWSILTLSHEMIHGHVRGLLGSIFGPDGDPTDAISAFCEWEKSKTWTFSSSIQRMQFDILNSVVHRDDLCFGNRGPRIKDHVPEEVRVAFERQYRMINEICVHVLDFLYIHDGDPEGYVGPLWVSWSPVPSVWDHTDEYVMRTLAAIGVMQEGSMRERMRSAVAVLQGELTKIPSTSEYHQTIQRALALISSAEFEPSHVYEFAVNQHLADVVLKYLYVRSIGAELLSDKRLIDVKGQRRRYTLDYPSHVDTGVESPVVFIREVAVANTRRGTVAGVESLRESAWLFTVASSHLDPERSVPCPQPE